MEPSEREIDRQYRVLKMRVAMHAALRDRYKRAALLSDLLLLACSVTFCAAAFVGDEVLRYAGMQPQTSRLIISAAAVCAFFLSLASLRVAWKEEGALHRAAVQRLTAALSEFRRTRLQDKSWPAERLLSLHEEYWAAVDSVVEIPERSFLALKAKYLRKVAVSEWLDHHPWCPVAAARAVLVVRDYVGRSAARESPKDRP